MAFKSLLLSKDAEVVQTLIRLLKDLDIAVEPCSEPFAAAKRLMDQHFDAILVDCDDEQGAGWVLQSARMAVGSNKCVTIAIVGPRSASRGGPKASENFVIQKPIVLKQVESILRAARNLMGDGEPGSHVETPASPSGVTAPSPAVPLVSPAAHAAPTAQGRPPAEIFDELTAAVDRLGPSAPPARPVPVPASMSTGAAAAPAPAWEKPAPLAPAPWPDVPRPAQAARTELSKPPAPSAAETTAVVPLAATPAEMKSAVQPSQAPQQSNDAFDQVRRRLNNAAQPAWRTEGERVEVPAPRFSTFSAEVESPKGFPFKAIAAAMVLVSFALFGYSWHRNQRAAASPQRQPQAVAAVPMSQPAPEAANVAPATDGVSASEQETSAPTAVEPEEKSSAPAVSEKPSKRKSNAHAEPAEDASTADSSLPPAPLVVSGGKVETAPRPSPAEAPVAPSLNTVAQAGKPDLGGVVSSAAVKLPQMAPQPPQRIRVSQGVTQGLLVHQVTPQYPAAARETQVEGDVVLEAVIGKDGRVRGLKAISGPPLLVQPAINAVRQWRYKPYLLNGQPVEVETQIKLQFRL